MSDLLTFCAGVTAGVLACRVAARVERLYRRCRERREVEAVRQQYLAILSEPLHTVRNKPDGSYTWVWRFPEENPEQVIDRILTWAR